MTTNMQATILFLKALRRALMMIAAGLEDYYKALENQQAE